MLEYLARHASGLTLRQIALESFMSYSHVASSINEAKRLLRARTLAAACMKAHGLGMLSEPDEEGTVTVTRGD